ncbi:metal-sensitive transcriptional regulator [Heliomicrobium gestii]|nr:metal-sensitive transcriptional regulator [Heliomicrobium gestii]MBM7866115.1 DNA-binding FrmR family transcriptional regulator [Heliomicrobium gestii]
MNTLDDRNTLESPPSPGDADKSPMLPDRNRQDLINRMRRLEGQVRGITKMIEDQRYCVDILLQVSAARAGLQKVGLSILENHTRGCVTTAIKENRGDEMVAELIDVLDRFMK